MLKRFAYQTMRSAVWPAAFRRLCVETWRRRASAVRSLSQPPLGGCVLKRDHSDGMYLDKDQPPLGGCVLKRFACMNEELDEFQPPLGGCVLKQ